MTLLYADTSALVRAYIADEPDHVALRALLLDGADPIVTCELARVEFASALAAAARAGRLVSHTEILARFDLDCTEGGPIVLLRLRTDLVFSKAAELVIEHRLRTLDAIHLAVAIVEGPALAPESGVTLVTRDAAQAAAATELGLAVN